MIHFFCRSINHHFTAVIWGWNAQLLRLLKPLPWLVLGINTALWFPWASVWSERRRMIILRTEELKQAESVLKQFFPESIKVWRVFKKVFYFILKRLTYRITTMLSVSPAEEQQLLIMTCFPGLWLYIQHKQRETSQSASDCRPVARFHCHYLQTESTGNIILHHIISLFLLKQWFTEQNVSLFLKSFNYN